MTRLSLNNKAKTSILSYFLLDIMGREACPSRSILETKLLALLGSGGAVDNITVYPDGRLTINTPTDSIERKWR